MITFNRVYSRSKPWSVWNQLSAELNDIWEQHSQSSHAPANLWTREDEAVLTVLIPSRRLEDVQVSVHRDVVTIEAAAAADDLPEGTASLRRERHHPQFSRKVKLPFEIDPEQVEATYERGQLRIQLRRHQSTLPTKIAVKSA
ncbi:MAG: Hsp20/alpha crystallin family protein [Planctomycetaceae bacterium]|nr:Hsp20/alpha crystallin family protein [Planctomycetaceae bacterium]